MPPSLNPGKDFCFVISLFPEKDLDKRGEGPLRSCSVGFTLDLHALRMEKGLRVPHVPWSGRPLPPGESHLTYLSLLEDHLLRLG